MEGRYKARGLRVVSVIPYEDEPPSDEEKKLVDDAAKEEHEDYPCFLDLGAKWSEKAGIDSVPSFLVVGRDGKVVGRVEGALRDGNEALKTLTSLVEKALDAPKG